MENEISRESLGVAFNGSIEGFRFNAVDGGKVRIQDHFFTAQRQDAGFDRVSRNNNGALFHRYGGPLTEGIEDRWIEIGKCDFKPAGSNLSAPMTHRLLGQTGLAVSPVGFGAWQLNNPLWGGTNEADSIALVHAALDAGCNFFDTAPAYGEGASERLLGEALRGRRDTAVICTKFGHTGVEAKDFSVAAVRPTLEDSLRRLRTDRVDLLLLHNPPAALLDGGVAADLYGELAALQREGKLRAFGASIDRSAELRTLARTTRSGAAEVLFNAFHQEPRAAFGDASARGLGLIAKVPLDSGWLSGNYDARSRFAGIRERWTPGEIARRGRLVAKLRALLPPGTPLAQAALAFILAHPEISTAIPGAKSRAQLESNLAAGRAPLPASTVSAIRQLWQEEISGEPLPW